MIDIRKPLLAAFLCLTLATGAPALADPMVPTSAPSGQQTFLYTTPGTYSLTLPPSPIGAASIPVWVDACQGGQGGAGGQASAGGGAGGGGGSGQCTKDYKLSCAPGATLTIVVSTAGVGGTIGNAGANPTTNTSVSGCNTPFPTLYNSLSLPATGVAGAGGIGGRGAMSQATGSACTGGAGGTTTTAGSNGSALVIPALIMPNFVPGSCGGGGGGSNGSTGQIGGGGTLLPGWVDGLGGTASGAAAAGAGGAASLWGMGGIGGTLAGAGSAPLSGWGGGGGGGSSNTAGGNGANGFVLIGF